MATNLFLFICDPSIDPLGVVPISPHAKHIGWFPFRLASISSTESVLSGGFGRLVENSSITAWSCALRRCPGGLIEIANVWTLGCVGIFRALDARGFSV